MTVPKIYLDGTEINFTVKDSYELELNPVSNKRQWSMEIWAGPNYFKPEQYSQIMALLTSGTHTYIAEDGNSYEVKVSGNPSVSGVLQGYPIISVTFTEPGFDDEDSGDDIEITGTLGLRQFVAKLSDYSEDYAPFGEMTRTINGNMVTSDSPYLGDYRTYSLRLEAWDSWENKTRRGYSLSLSFTYTDPKTGNNISIYRNGYVVSRSRSGNTITLNFEQYGAMP